MFISLSAIAGKLVRNSVRLVRGNGSALPGLVVERINPNFLASTLKSLDYGVVVVSGTNGKTTTTKIVVELLESQGLKVFTNSSGSNFTRGVASEIISKSNWCGQLNADIAVLELDEAHAVGFVQRVKPRYTLLLNVLRDQLDRFGEIDYTAGLLQKVANATTDKVIINREDPRLRKIGSQLPTATAIYYGLSPELRCRFPNDEQLHGKKIFTEHGMDATTVLKNLSGQTIEYELADKTYQTRLSLSGIYNSYNAIAAVATVEAILGTDTDIDLLQQKLSDITPAFGRGETIRVNNQPIEIILVKNPSGFQLALESYNNSDCKIMLAINDAYADGRDVSWLYDVDFSSLASEVSITSGSRAYDIALRLNYSDISVAQIMPSIAEAMSKLISHRAPYRIYCTYTAMLNIRRELAKHSDLIDGLS